MKVFLVFVILVHVSQASGVEVYEGAESVLLPCLISRIPEDPVVVWSRLDLNPATVHQHREEGGDPGIQNQRYSSRTAMSTVALETGDLSLTLNKPRLCDSGSYTCSVRSGEHEVRRVDVQLQVKESFTFPAEALALLVLLVVVVIAAVLTAVYLWNNVITVSRVEVEEGLKCVKLPCKTLVQLPEDVTVEWSRSDPEPMKVHTYQSGNDGRVRQDEFYSGRTKMETNPVNRGELSLTLSDPCYRDSGTYICTVHKDRDVWVQSGTAPGQSRPGGGGGRGVG
ncbi:uncharacterized protein LOC108873348 isoform X1 [Lates calcarifer]|uniref:Uncharacterized protein LOC108873348 isoform X1 n=1 Tax=Lates calcarifer TaxID=8187 RepID=A0AAJ7LAF6_LATCA|nr:uncharacterized protein LOC108873348 isoform X1 [Lates calcarifer]